MTIDEFWKLIELIDQDILRKGEGFDEEAIEPLIVGLIRLNKKQLEAFEDHLASCLFQLDGRAYADAAGESGNSENVFLYVRCFVVARGRKAFEETLGNPALMPNSIDQWCEPLLYAASEAWAENNESEWDYDSETSYETGSNTEQW